MKIIHKILAKEANEDISKLNRQDGLTYFHVKIYKRKEEIKGEVKIHGQGIYNFIDT